MTAIHIRRRGLGQDGNAPYSDIPGESPLGMPSIGVPSAQARAGLPVSMGAGFNWRSMYDEKVAARKRLPTVLANALTTRAGSWYPSNTYGTVRTRGLGQDVFTSGGVTYQVDASGNVSQNIGGSWVPLAGGTESVSSAGGGTTATTSSSGFNVNAFISNLLGAGLTAFKTSQQADLQSQLLQRGYVINPKTGQVTTSAALTASSMMPILLIGGLLVVVMMMAKR